MLLCRVWRCRRGVSCVAVIFVMDDGELVLTEVAFRGVRHCIPADSFCLMCQYPATEQTDVMLRDLLTQLEARSRILSMGHDFKASSMQ